MLCLHRCAAASSALFAVVCLPLPAQQTAPENLARTATASASESQGAELAPAFGIDGDPASRWSGIPGHNAGVWYELDWSQPVTFRQIVVQQYDTYVKELDVQVWDGQQQDWRTLQHCGSKDRKLPLVLVVDVAAVTTGKLRLHNITNGPSFTEVMVYAAPRPPATVLGADLAGHAIGVVCDAWGSAPVAGAAVALDGDAVAGPWHAAATSDEHGMFTVALPVGLRGDVTVRTTVAGAVYERKHAAVALQYGLTPRSPGDGVLLDGKWQFLADPPAGFEREEFAAGNWSELAVPGHWRMQGHRAPGGTGGYRRTFDAENGRGRWLLRFDGVYSGAKVWVNGVCVAEHDGGALPFEADVTDVVRGKGNVLAVLATEHTVVSDRLDKMSEYADMELGGIFRSVRLLSVPDLHVAGVALATTFEAEGAATVSGTVAVVAASAVAWNGVELRVRLSEPGGPAVASAAVPFALAGGSRRELPVRLLVPAARRWNAEQPQLYVLDLELYEDDRRLQTVSQRFGLRQTEVRGREILVNGRPVKLRGTCHHDSDPLLGRAVTPALQRRDVELMRAANLNAVRTSHYPPHEALLDAADELGLYVEDEASFCWTSASDDLRLLPVIAQLECEMLARDRNHASVLFWSLCNESQVGTGLWRARDIVRRLDPSRPIGGSWAADGSLDLAVRHNPITIAGIDDVEKNVRAPVLWDESWCIWQDIWSDAGELWRDPGLRDAYVAPLPAIYDRFVHSPAVQGTMIWAWSDDIFLLPGAGLEYGRGDSRERYVHAQYAMPGRGVVGDAQWGVVDAWRRPKPEFLHTKKLHSPVRIAGAPLAIPTDGTLRIAVENQFDFRELAGLRFHWQLGEASGSARAAVPPRSRGTLAIELPRPPKRGEWLQLRVADGEAEIDDARLRIGEPEATPAERGTAGAAVGPALALRPALSVRTEQRLNGSTTYVAGQDFELGVGGELGDLRRGVAFGQALLRSLPQLHVMATGRPHAPLPAPASWRLTHFEARRDGDDAVVAVKGDYDGFTGGYEYRIRRDGCIEASATFVHTGEPVQVRELGLAFAVPSACDALQWSRRAEWAIYPQDHIGRPGGRARAFAVHRDQLPPTWPWAEDNTPLGCNDFRSSKRAIDSAWIGVPDSPGVAIESDGSQNLRATVDADHIDVVVTDFLGGCNGLGEWTSNYGTGRQLGKGETVKARVVLRFVAGPPPLPQ